MMLTGNKTTLSHSLAKEQTGILTIGRTPMLAEGFRELVASHVGNDVTVDATCYSNSFNRNQHLEFYRAVFIVIDSPQAFTESVALIEGLRANNMASIIFAAITGSGTYNKMKYYLAGADYCIKVNSTLVDSGEEISGILSSPELQVKDSLMLDPTRMCLIADDKKLDVSFAEMKILEAFSQTKSHILSHDEIARIMGLNINFYDPRALEKSISRLRGKIKDMYGTNAIHSIRGYGYRLIRGLISTT
ncbi:winged helix-turn-helix transcriptional regulator [Pseudomonas sp. PCH199]|uniref:winged helix-turn-helix domain-containing protein n=1 Tax=unclassified Pseudomonas TaxID=196821 RepID=UPI000BD51110|nr:MULTISPECIES: winged helix-turn-helix domain-containing protein [unclassified Pseudomonas]MCW8277186.1 winged helix-turn-helix transcriptional regulator [Pseudomonas sp. PCH199]PAM82669.1 response regulator receiver protein [Pseudomonas sp. ERMR1:02]